MATTVWSILAEIISGRNTQEQKALLVSFYLPYFVVPFLLALVMALAGPAPFGTAVERKLKK